MIKARIQSIKPLFSVDEDSTPERATAGNYLGCTPAEIAEYVAQDNALADAFDRGEWYYQATQAQATIVFYLDSHPNGTAQTLRLTSPGIYGTESDSGADYFQDLYEQELDTLTEMLQALGFSEKDIEKALK